MEELTRDFLINGSIEVATKVGIGERGSSGCTALTFSVRKGKKPNARFTITYDDMQKLNWTLDTRISLRRKDDIFYAIKDIKGRKITTNGNKSSMGNVEFYKLNNGISPILFENQNVKYLGEIKNNIDNIVIFRKRVDLF